jgi:DNA-binding transcriptional ArsR family regulator
MGGRRKKRRERSGDKDALFKALAHPLRRKVLELILTEEQLSPVKASRHLEGPLSSVSYHVRVLDELGAVELVEELPRRGSIEHFYSATETVKRSVGTLMPPPDASQP